MAGVSSPAAAAKNSLDFVNIAFLSITPLVAVFGTGYYVWHYGVTWFEITSFVVMYLFTGIAITGGYHRYYSHKSYECSKALQLFYLIFGAAAAENSVLNWASDHRYHHRFVDQPEDPYDITRGGFFAHMGWIFYKDGRDVHSRFLNVPDLLKDPLVRWQDRWYLVIFALAGFGLPAVLGAWQGRTMGMVLWAGFLRVVVVQHMTFFINSLAHLYGSRPYCVTNTARDSWWLGFFTFGEGYHNFHHKFQADYRNGIRWYQFDMTKWWLRVINFLGQARKLRQTPETLILKARLEVDMLMVQNRLSAAGANESLWEKARHGLEQSRKRLELALTQYHQAKLDAKRQRHDRSDEMRRQWSEKLARYRQEFHAAYRHWNGLIASVNRMARPSARGLLTLTALLDVLKQK